VRIEKGVNTSGLLGERLMLSDDPQRNSLVQRKWLYCDDPALNYKYACSVPLFFFFFWYFDALSAIGHLCLAG
jgi:hypothetical protein